MVLGGQAPSGDMTAWTSSRVSNREKDKDPQPKVTGQSMWTRTAWGAQSALAQAWLSLLSPPTLWT